MTWSLIKKEWRIIAPVAAVILCVHLLAYAELLLNADRLWSNTWGYLLTAQWVLFHILAVLPFGMEFHSGSMERLLSQPVNRRRIWWRKVTPMIVFFALVFLLNTLLYLVQESRIIEFLSSAGVSRRGWHYTFPRMAPFVVIPALMATCGGLCMSLYARKLLVAFWMALLLPFIGSIVIIFFLTILNYCGWVSYERYPWIAWSIMAWLAVVYPAATYTLAYRRFMRLEV
jgi:hypothetical protein